MAYLPSNAGIGIANNNQGQIGYAASKIKDPAAQNINDYGSIMKGYGDVAKNNNYTPISYTSSGDVSSALGNLKNFSDTGGYSNDDIKNIRERGISPIRSVYEIGKSVV